MVRYVHLIFELFMLMDTINFSWSICKRDQRNACMGKIYRGYCTFGQCSEDVFYCNPFNLSEIYHTRYYNCLNIQNSNVYEIKPASFRYFNNLQKLTMSDDNIFLLEPGSFSGLTNLRVLNLSINDIQTISKGVFSGLYNLEALDLSYNNIEDIDNNSIAGTDSLKFLYLDHNNISDMPSLGNSCQQLKVLDISNNRIENLQFIRSCSMLDLLIVANNNLTTFSSDPISASITGLDISGNNLNSIDSEDLAKFVQLKQLNLSRNSLFENSDMPTDLFYSTVLLEVLNLSSTSISKLSVGVFSRLQKLKVLDISSNNLTYLPRGIFHDIDLRILDISNNQLSFFQYDGNLQITLRIVLNNNLWTCNSLSAIVKRNNYIVERGNVHNTTNIAGIACHEEVKDFQNINAYNYSNSNNFQTEYLAQIMKTQVSMRDTFAVLKNYFLNQTNRPPVNYSESGENKDVLLDLKHLLNATNSNIEGYANALQRQVSTADNSLAKLAEVLELLENDTAAIALVEQKSENDIKQMIELQRSLIDLARKNYSVDHWKKFETIQNDLKRTLLDIKQILATKSQPQIAARDSLTATRPETFQTSSANTSEIVALYCIFVTLLVLIFIILFTLYKKFTYVKRDRDEDTNPLSSLTI